MAKRKICIEPTKILLEEHGIEPNVDNVNWGIKTFILGIYTKDPGYKITANLSDGTIKMLDDIPKDRLFKSGEMVCMEIDDKDRDDFLSADIKIIVEKSLFNALLDESQDLYIKKQRKL